MPIRVKIGEVEALTTSDRDDEKVKGITYPHNRLYYPAWSIPEEGLVWA